MTSEQTITMVFKNEAGDYFLVPQATLEQGRVPAERRAEIEGLIAEAKADDVSGHLFWLGVFLGATATFGTGAVYLDVTQEKGTLKGWGK